MVCEEHRVLGSGPLASVVDAVDVEDRTPILSVFDVGGDLHAVDRPALQRRPLHLKQLDRVRVLLRQRVHLGVVVGEDPVVGAIRPRKRLHRQIAVGLSLIVRVKVLDDDLVVEAESVQASEVSGPQEELDLTVTVVVGFVEAAEQPARFLEGLDRDAHEHGTSGVGPADGTQRDDEQGDQGRDERTVLESHDPRVLCRLPASCP